MPKLLGSLLSGPEAAHRFLEIDRYLGHCPSPWQHTTQAGAPRRLNAGGGCFRGWGFPDLVSPPGASADHLYSKPGISPACLDHRLLPTAPPTALGHRVGRKGDSPDRHLMSS